MSRSKDTPSGSRKVARCTRMNQPRWTVSSPSGGEHREVGRRASCPRPQPTAPMSIRWGSRPSARARAAPTSSRKSGWGWSGRLLNSGWAWVPDPERVAGELDELDQPTVGRHARADQAGLLERAPVAGIHLVAVAVALGHHHVAVGLGHLGARQQAGVVGAEPHGPALVGHVDLVVHQVDDRVAGGGLELAGVGALQCRPATGRPR